MLSTYSLFTNCVFVSSVYDVCNSTEMDHVLELACDNFVSGCKKNLAPSPPLTALTLNYCFLVPFGIVVLSSLLLFVRTSLGNLKSFPTATLSPIVCIQTSLCLNMHRLLSNAHAILLLTILTCLPRKVNLLATSCDQWTLYQCPK